MCHLTPSFPLAGSAYLNRVAIVWSAISCQSFWIILTFCYIVSKDKSWKTFLIVKVQDILQKVVRLFGEVNLLIFYKFFVGLLIDLSNIIKQFLKSGKIFIFGKILFCIAQLNDNQPQRSTFKYVASTCQSWFVPVVLMRNSSDAWSWKPRFQAVSYPPGNCLKLSSNLKP